MPHVPCIETLASPAFAGDVFFMWWDACDGYREFLYAGLRPATDFLFAREGRIFIRLRE